MINHEFSEKKSNYYSWYIINTYKNKSKIISFFSIYHDFEFIIKIKRTKDKMINK